MDDDDLRRGKPTAHKKWDEATAVLAGDALQSFAFEQIASLDCPADRKVDLISKLAQAAGAAGMVYGQALDIAAEQAETPFTLEQIQDLQQGKTGALIGWSAAAGPRMAGDDPSALLNYARSLGLAFEIVDDVLDVVGNEEVTGKRLGKDHKAGKATFVSLLGLEAARQKAQDLIEEAVDALCTYDTQADDLREAARFVVSREF